MKTILDCLRLQAKTRPDRPMLTDETETRDEPAGTEPEKSGKHSLSGWLRRLFS